MELGQIEEVIEMVKDELVSIDNYIGMMDTVLGFK